jgi:glycosyltransferase involved in cell wall biosynthesis
MSQNLLPFEWGEIRRFGISPFALKLIILGVSQRRAFALADGVIFLSQAAMDQVGRVIGEPPVRHTIVPHGIEQRFRLAPRKQRAVTEYSPERPFRLLYVSHVWPYKHHQILAEAVARLRAEGLPVQLDLVGGAYAPSLQCLMATLERLDPRRSFIFYHGEEPHERIFERYHEADVFVFASSCETFGQIVTEAMSAGLPVVCSNRAAMPEILQDAGRYFDPENVAGLARVLREVIGSVAIREEMAWRAFQLAADYTWRDCANKTFGFIARVMAECKSSQPPFVPRHF